MTGRGKPYTVESIDNGYVTLKGEDSIFCGFDMSDGWDTQWGIPRKGDTYYVKGDFGRPLEEIQMANGVIIRDKSFYTRKTDERKEKWAQERRDELEKNRLKWAKEVAGLDAPFRGRIERFISEAGGFDEFFGDTGGYELFCVTQANGLYREYMTCGQPHYTFWDKAKKDDHANDWFDGFRAMSLEQQKRVFAGLDEGHSGNTFGATIALARQVALGNSI